MAISATFLADFNAFVAETRRTERVVQEFARELGVSERQASRLSNAFSGKDIVQQATLATKAVEQIGGVSKLTESEQQRLNSTLVEAMAKYKALGQEAPKAMSDLAEATRRVDPPSQTLTSRMVALGAAVGTFVGNLAFNLISQAGTALFNMGKEAFQSAGKILDLSSKTGLTTETIQQMQYVADQTGTSLETFTQAAFMLGTRLAGGSGSVQKAVQALGLSFREVQSMTPDEQMATFAEALGRVQDATERNRLGLDLYGKTFSQIAPAIAQGYTRMADGAMLATDTQLQALDKAADRWSAFLSNTKTGVAAALGEIVMAFDRMGRDASDSLQPLERGIDQSLTNIDRRFTKTLVHAEDILNEVGRLAAEHAKELPIVILKAGEAEETYAGQLKKVKAELAALTPAQRAELDVALELGKKTDELTARFGLSEEALQLYTRSTKQSAQTLKEATRDAAQAAKEAAADYIRLTRAMEGDWQKILSEQWERAAASIRRSTEAARIELEKFIKVFKEIGQAIPTELPLARAFDQLPMASINAAREAQEGMIGVLQEVGQQIPDAIEPPSGWASVWAGLTGAASGVLRDLNAIFQRAFEGGGGIGGAVKSLVTNITAALLSLIPGIGPILSQFAGAFVAFGKKVWGWLTGGPSEAEVAGRQAAAKFTQALEEALSAGGLATVSQLVAEGASRNWAIQAVAIQEAFIATGRSAEEALVWVDRLWRAEAEGPQAVAAVIAELQPILDQHKQTLEATAVAAEAAMGDIAALTDPLDIFREKIDAAEIVHDLEAAITEFGQTGQIQFRDVTRWVQDLERMLGTNNLAVQMLRDAMTTWAQTGVLDIQQVLEAFGILKTELSAGINIPIEFQMARPPSANQFGGGDGGGGGGGGYLTPDEARERGVPWRPKDEFEWSDSQYRNRRDEDISELNKQLEEAADAAERVGEGIMEGEYNPNMPSFQRGTGGRYLDFRGGTPALLHGRERVVTEAEGRREGAAWTAMETRLAAIEALLRDWPRAMGIVMKDAYALGGGR